MKTIKLYKKFKKYEYGTPDVAEGLEGGLTGKQKFSQGVGYANAGLQVANMGMQMFGDQGNEFGVKDDGSAIAGGALSGAAQGASMGSVAGPWGCVCAGTKVITNLGEFKNVEDLKQEDGIVGWDGSKYVQQDIVGFQPPAKKECLEIETRLGHTLRCSADHPIYSSGQGRALRSYVDGVRTRIKRYEYIDADKLKLGDNIGLINEVPIWGTKVMTTPYLVGACIGDGTYGKNKGVRLFSADPDTWDYLEFNDLAYQIDKNQYKNNNKELRSYRLKDSIKLFKELGIYGQVKINKRLPNNIHLYDKDSICKLIAGLIDTDGYISFDSKKPKNGKIGFGQSNIVLIKQVREQLIKLGIHSSLKTIKKTKKFVLNKECDIKERYVLSIKDRYSVINFYNNIQLNISYKKQNLENFYNYIKELGVKDHKEHTNVCADKVAKITYIGLQDIYNLEAAGSHTYIANLIITHNTAIGAGVGGIYGGIKAYQGNEEAKARQEEFESQQRQLSIKESQNKWQQTLASGFKPQGNEFATKYAKFGGLVEMKNGGNVQQLSKDAVEFKGNSHEMGGIKEPVVNGRVLEGAEVEDEETMQGNFIFSEELGFAQRHKPLAKMLGKLEKKAQSNPNDKVNNSTIARVNSRINSLKKEQEETKEALGIENDSEEMKNGGLYKKMAGGGPYDFTVKGGVDNFLQNYSDQQYMNSHGAGLKVDGRSGRMTGMAKATGYMTPLSKKVNANKYAVTDPQVLGIEKENIDDTTMMLPEGSTSKTSVNWGNLASGLAPYAGVAANYMVNEQAKKLRLPQEKLTTPISLQRVNYDNQRAEADIQRGQLNKITNRNLTNSAVASAVMAQNLGTTIRQKNAINESEMNTNRLIGNEEVGKNKSIEQLNNRTQVDNEDRFYNRDRDYLQNKGQIATNLSSMLQKQRADRMKYDLEDRKIDIVADADAGRGVFGRTGEDDRKKAKDTYRVLSSKKYGGKSSLRKKMNC